MTPTSAEIRAAREAAHRTKETNMKGIISALESAIFAETPFAVGEWSVNAGEGYVQLVWTCDQADTPEMYGDEPWSEWGGNSILAAAGVRQFARASVALSQASPAILRSGAGADAAGDGALRAHRPLLPRSSCHVPAR